MIESSNQISLPSRIVTPIILFTFNSEQQTQWNKQSDKSLNAAAKQGAWQHLGSDPTRPDPLHLNTNCT